MLGFQVESLRAQAVQAASAAQADGGRELFAELRTTIVRVEDLQGQAPVLGAGGGWGGKQEDGCSDEIV